MAISSMCLDVLPFHKVLYYCSCLFQLCNSIPGRSPANIQHLSDLLEYLNERGALLAL